ncbi:hypothetical protein ACFLYO_01735 [Chloroflexota bacterium]
MRSYSKARQQLSTAQFELEKELARYRIANATTVMLVLIEITLAIFAVATVVAPTLRTQPPQTLNIVAEIAEIPFVTAAPNNLLAGTPPPNFAEGVEIPGLEDELNLQPFATPRPTPTPVGTIIPDAPPAIGCDTEQAQLIIPANGMVVFEATTVVGSAYADNFALYKFELNGPETNNGWAMHSAYNTPIEGPGNLGQIIPAQLTPGEYKFRLVVFDTFNEPQATCEITLFVSEPIPTATPIR